MIVLYERPIVTMFVGAVNAFNNVLICLKHYLRTYTIVSVKGTKVIYSLSFSFFLFLFLRSLTVFRTLHSFHLHTEFMSSLYSRGNVECEYCVLL